MREHPVRLTLVVRSTLVGLCLLATFILIPADGAEAFQQAQPQAVPATLEVTPTALEMRVGDSAQLQAVVADRAVQTAVSHGAERILEPMDMDYGDRQGGVIDPSGNIWWISTRLVKEPYDK